MDPQTAYRHDRQLAGNGDFPMVQERFNDRSAVRGRRRDLTLSRGDSSGGGRHWQLLGDDLFRMVHRSSDGACLLDERMAGFAMAAALLGELTVAGRLTVNAGLVHVLDQRAPADVVAHSVLDQVVRERAEHPVRTWLVYLGDSAYVEVAGRMARAGHVEKQLSRRWWNRKMRYVPTDMNAAGWPWARLTDALRRSEPLQMFDLLLGGLAVATDLHCSALVGDAGPFASAISSQLKAAPAPVRELVALTRAAAGDAVITRT
ncbi:GOLPH3/VPS74 family protein [Paractinoplanes lichenicola]|uniref:GPP34 family phosphoprotein n=1 Tax=Paractinoplanes lichenicola TaxID=2802976 RepID=A0ABS1W3R4_9ACTN|nr:GPP34 family phosphoprotein [Actinoplanes lichenicola]MBL7261355.1 GPP34 family phosphoprotein [Actinoplanes lichenicola]